MQIQNEGCTMLFRDQKHALYRNVSPLCLKERGFKFVSTLGNASCSCQQLRVWRGLWEGRGKLPCRCLSPCIFRTQAMAIFSLFNFVKESLTFDSIFSSKSRVTISTEYISLWAKTEALMTLAFTLRPMRQFWSYYPSLQCMWDSRVSLRSCFTLSEVMPSKGSGPDWHLLKETPKWKLLKQTRTHPSPSSFHTFVVCVSVSLFTFDS